MQEENLKNKTNVNSLKMKDKASIKQENGGIQKEHSEVFKKKWKLKV